MTLDGYPLALVAIALWREAQNQTDAAILGVACVMRNRVTLAHDIVHVVTQPWQFSSMTAPGDANLIKWPETGDAAFVRCCAVVDSVFGSAPVADVTGGATFYFSPPLTAPPSAWG